MEGYSVAIPREIRGGPKEVKGSKFLLARDVPEFIFSNAIRGSTIAMPSSGNNLESRRRSGYSRCRGSRPQVTPWICRRLGNQKYRPQGSSLRAGFSAGPLATLRLSRRGLMVASKGTSHDRTRPVPEAKARSLRPVRPPNPISMSLLMAARPCSSIYWKGGAEKRSVMYLAATSLRL
jgi:intein/homing endonuclease